ncbi:MAG: DinB family protein [Acidobacteriaceae bacterium]|nr:DinB family protein [Acidobacteriaceae bacterium]MBV8568970.1 DinB family protein [Acidobacteriaceae bacterium]
MTSREFFVERRRAEFPVFLNVLKALPADQLSYKPHERSPSAEQVVWTLTTELGACVEAVTQYKAEWKATAAPPLSEMIALFERWSNELIDHVSKMNDAEWNRTAQFYYNGKMVSEQPAGQFLWFILFDAIHHRGQLSAYLRPMGGTVPSIYGPSADSRSAGA